MGRTTLFVEPFSGMAGDMFLAALLDLSDQRFTLALLSELARQLVGAECALSTERAWRGSLSGVLLDVRTGESGHSAHRGLADCQRLIERASLLGPRAQTMAKQVFERMARAEAHVHGCGLQEVHFHEVGAVDALIDVCGAALALERLEVGLVYATPPITGSGTVQCAHGQMPVPAPGTAEILRGLPHHLGGGSGERLTPTGAALLAELVGEFRAPGNFVSEKIGYGAGHRDPKDGPPNILRVQLGRVHDSGPGPGRDSHSDPGASAPRGLAWLMECTLDDMTGEELGHLLGRLRQAGALEVWSHAVQMKKDRPGVVVSALVRQEQRAALERAAFDHSSSLGLRWSMKERSELQRESVLVSVLGESVRFSVRSRPWSVDGARSAFDVSPEYDDVVSLAKIKGLAWRDAEQAALAAFQSRPGSARG